MAIPDVLLIEPDVHRDERGFFVETWSQRHFAAAGIDRAWVQDNCSRSTRGVLRGLHYQLTRPQAKLVRCPLGEVFDVAVDLRRGSATFGRWVAATLSEHNQHAMFIPEGFAHGFLVLSEVADFHYKCSEVWVREDERGVAWDCPEIGIAWPIIGAPDLSPRDAQLPVLRDQPDVPAARQ